MRSSCSTRRAPEFKTSPLLPVRLSSPTAVVLVLGAPSDRCRSAPRRLQSGQQVVPGGHVCSGFLTLLGGAVLPVTSPAAGRDAVGVVELCDIGWGAQLAPTGHVASG